MLLIALIVVAAVVLERRTGDAYDAAVDKFRQRRLKTDALVKLIELTIVPELQAERRVTALATLPEEQQRLVTHAGEYLRLLQRKVAAPLGRLKTTSMQRLRQAEKTGRASLGELEQIGSETDALPLPDPE